MFRSRSRRCIKQDISRTPPRFSALFLPFDETFSPTCRNRISFSLSLIFARVRNPAKNRFDNGILRFEIATARLPLPTSHWHVDEAERNSTLPGLNSSAPGVSFFVSSHLGVKKGRNRLPRRSPPLRETGILLLRNILNLRCSHRVSVDALCFVPMWLQARRTSFLSVWCRDMWITLRWILCKLWGAAQVVCGRVLHGIRGGSWLSSPNPLVKNTVWDVDTPLCYTRGYG